MREKNFNLEIKSVSKIFSNQFKALSKVSLSVGSGDVVALIGPSGSGKSTLLRLINQLETFDSGDILFNGQSFAANKMDSDKLRARIGMVFQSFNLFPHMTILDNLTLGPRQVKRMTKDRAESMAHEYLARVGIGEQAKKYPIQLSGGQQQRAAIARALIMQPELILFDEPTSALDPELVGEVLEIIGKLAAEKVTMMIVTHEMRFARKIASKAVFMSEGEILEAGSAQWVFEDCPNPRIQQFFAKY